MVKEPFVVDLIRGEIIGIQKSSKQVDGRKQYKVRPILGTGQGMRARWLPYELDPAKDVFEAEPSRVGRVKFLRPVSDIEGVAESRTLWHRMVEKESEAVGDVKEENNRLKKKVRKQQKRIDELLDELDEDDDDSRQTGGMRCSICGYNGDRSEFEANGGVCPSCDTVHPAFDQSRAGDMR